MGVGEGKEIVRDREGQRVTSQRDREIDRETEREKGDKGGKRQR